MEYDGHNQVTCHSSNKEAELTDIRRVADNKPKDIRQRLLRIINDHKPQVRHSPLKQAPVIAIVLPCFNVNTFVFGALQGFDSGMRPHLFTARCRS
jgi:hypothetical protein